MDSRLIGELTGKGNLRLRSKDIHRAASLLEAAASTAEVALGIPTNEKSATVIFRELYEAIRQLGEALWWALGYEVVESHEAALLGLQQADISRKVNLNKLDRFRDIRHDANYSGYKVTVEQAKEIVNFWNACGSELIIHIRKTAGIQK